MRFSLPTVASFIAYALAAPIAAPEAASSSEGFLAIPLTQNGPLPPSKIPNFAAGSDPITVEMINEVMSYMVEIEIGGQKNKVHIDTGSDYLWVWNSDSTTCKSRDYKDQCVSDGSYDPSKSSTSKDLESTFYIKYGKGSASGEYYSDKASLGPAEVNELKFGVNPNYVTDGGFSTVFGIGPNSDNDSNFSKQLLKDGKIKRQVYAMSFGDIQDKSSSEITFGAINTGRFEGDLEKLPIVNDGKGHFTVKGNGTYGDTQFIEDGDIILDSGTSLTYLTTPNYNKFYQRLEQTGVELHPQDGGLYVYLCDDNSKIPDAVFKFGNKEIKLTSADFSINANLIDARNSDKLCILGVAEGDGTMNLFGDTFLRSIYSVYDLERSEVHVAQAKRGQANNYKVVDGDVPSN